MNTLKIAAIERNKKWMATLPKNPPEVEFSKKHIKEMKKILDKMRKDRYHRFTRKTTMLIVAAVIVVLSTITVFATDLGKYILDELSDHAIFQSLFESDEVVDGKIECGYIPEEFELIQEAYRDNHCLLIYENTHDEHFSLLKTQNGYEVGFDTEGTQGTTIKINDKEYVLYTEANDYNRVVWCNYGYTYYLVGKISSEEALKIAENVK